MSVKWSYCNFIVLQIDKEEYKTKKKPLLGFVKCDLACLLPVSFCVRFSKDWSFTKVTQESLMIVCPPVSLSDKTLISLSYLIILMLQCLTTLVAARHAQRRVNGHEVKSHFRGQEVSKKNLGTFTRLLIPTEDKKNGVEGGFFSVFIFAVVVGRPVCGWLQHIQLRTLHLHTQKQPCNLYLWPPHLGSCQKLISKLFNTYDLHFAKLFIWI